MHKYLIWTIKWPKAYQASATSLSTDKKSLKPAGVPAVATLAVMPCVALKITCLVILI